MSKNIRPGVFVFKANMKKNIPSKGHKFVVLLVFSIGIILSLVAFFLMRNQENRRLISEFNYLAEDRAAIFEDKVGDYIDLAQSLGSFYASSQSVERGEFSDFTKNILSRHKNIIDIDWIPRVLESERAIYEETASKDIRADFEIKESDKQGNLIKAGKREEYYPIYFIEPFESSKFVLGFDVSSDPARWEAMIRARDEGAPIITSKIKLLRKSDEDFGCRIFLPIYRNNLSHNTIEERRKNLTGFVSLLFKVGQTLSAAVQDTKPVGLDTYIYDDTVKEGEQLLYYYPARLQSKKSNYSIGVFSIYRGVGFSQAFDIGGRKWRIACLPSPGFIENHRAWQSWIFLIIGLLITFVSTVYLADVLNREVKIRSLVNQRTAELRDSEEKYRVLFDASRDAVMLVSVDKGFLGGNKATLEIFGCKDEEEFKSQNPASLSPEYQPDGQLSLVKSREMMKIAIDKGSHFFEWVHKRIDGREFTAVVLLSRMQLKGQELLQATVRDISESKQAEIALQRQKDELEIILNSAPAWIFYKDKENRLVRVNKSFADAMGMSHSELEGKAMLELYPQEQADSYWRDDLEVIQSGKPKINIVETVKIKDKTLWVKTDKVPYRDEQGNIIGVIGFTVDITEIRKAEEALSEANQFNKEIIANAAQGIVVLDKDLRCLEWNKFMEGISGLASSEVLYKNILSLFPDIIRLGIDKLLVRGFNGEYGSGQDAFYVNKNGEQFWLKGFYGPHYNAKGEIIGIIVVVTDITERKKLEDDLRAKEERFRTLVSNIPGAIYRCTNTPDWNMEFISYEIREISGYPAGDFINNKIRSYASIIHPEDKNMVWKSIQKAVADKHPYDLEYRIIHAHGNIRWVHEKGQGIFSEEGKLSCLDGAIFDITERYEVQQKVQKLSIGIEQSPAIVVITDKDGNIEYVNKKFVELTQYTFEEVKGKNPRVLKSGEQSIEFYKQLWDAILSGREWTGEFHNKKKNGQMYWELARISPIKNQSGVITNFIAIKEDITERKRIEAELKKAYDTMYSIIESAPFGIYIVNEKGNIELVNPAMLNISGATQEQFMGLNVFDFSPYRSIGLADKIKQCFIGERFKLETVEYTSSFGKKTTCRNFYGIPLEESGANKALIIVEDITERKRLENMKDEFVSTVSHELRTPLSIMREGISQILEGLHGKVNPKQKHFLIVSLTGIDRITRIVNNLLDLSKIESGRIELKIEPVDFTEVAKSVGAVLKSVAQSKKLKIKYNFSQAKIETSADKDRITEVFLNLVNNAIKFTDKGYIQIDISDKEDYIESSIIDTGIGIAEEDVPKLFTKFEQFGRPAVPIEKGIGLGLVICKGIVELHGGKIWVNSKFGKGTTVTFTIPKKTNI